ncbi:hypothetical protein EX30DRAFT_246408 [Ascodesmis nigricans]|uniref:Uncharacterized protein n=1 Tax=Ascodesmis nigricans TaxID=341454 RepID=A0A4S2MI90_9PEZI|nr:hypothetical protein EX30DRAFT_246408 [Ascodesmis nigricans]
MGGLKVRLTGPRKPSLFPKVIPEEVDPVPVFFLDETYDSAYESAGIEDDYTPPTSPALSSAMTTMNSTSAKRKASPLASAMRKTPSSIQLNKLVRFLDRVEIVPNPEYEDDEDEDDISVPSSDTFSSRFMATSSNKKQKLFDYDYTDDDNDLDFTDATFYQALVIPPTPETEIDAMDFDIGIASGLGRAGSPNRSPNRSPTRSPNGSTKDLTSPSTSPPPHDPARLSPTGFDTFGLSPSPPPSWRIPPESLIGRQPHVEEPPRVRSPTNENDEIDLRADEYYHSPVSPSTPSLRSSFSSLRSSSSSSSLRSSSSSSSLATTTLSALSASPPTSPRYDPGKETETEKLSPPTLKRKQKQSFRPPAMHPVIARKLPHGDVRFEDQWGRRLVPTEKGEGFRFDVWPVEEDVVLEERVGMKVGGWVKAREARGVM